MNRIMILLLLLLLAGCAARSSHDPNSLVSVQTTDKNGFSETISQKDRLNSYQKIDFLSPQTYQKVLRVYGKNDEGKNQSKITSYHPNGHIWQYLEIFDGRAQGVYREWFPSGKLKMELQVIEGSGDIHQVAQATWVFHGKNVIWDEAGQVEAEIFYEKGALQGTSLYYR